MTSIPKDYSTLSPVIISKNAQATIDEYKNILNAEENCGVMTCPKTGKIAHAGLKIGDSTIFVSDAFPEEGMNITGQQEFYLYVENTDNAFNKAKSARWNVVSVPEDMFWGDRIGTVKDGDGNTWKLAQRIRNVSPEEMEEAMKKMG